MTFITLLRGCKAKEKVFYMIFSVVMALKTKGPNYILTRQNYFRSNFDTIKVWDINSLALIDSLDLSNVGAMRFFGKSK